MTGSKYSRSLLVWFVPALVALAGLSPLAGDTEGPAPAGMFHDWSTRHLIYTQRGPVAAMLSAQRDPRARFGWTQRLYGRWDRRFPEPPRRMVRSLLHRDWSINLGAAGTAPAMYPAKYTFNINATPSCANDFIAFPVNAAGTASQPNLVGFNNLYSGTSGGTDTGVCNRTATASDTGTAATVLWSYAVQGITGGGAVTTSPVLAFDPSTTNGISGAKIAFVESASGSPAHFHVLAWKANDGQNASNLQSVLTPKVISSFIATAPAVGSGAVTDLALGSSTNGTVTLSSPFVDYARDVAYVGNDIGTLYRIKDVFCTSINADCQGSTLPAPSIDGTWGTGGAVSVCGGQLTGPVLDPVTLNVFVGCSDGKLYMVTQSGAVTSIVVGDGVASKTYGAIVDPPVVDGVNGFVYAASGSANNGANGALVQTTTTLSSSVAIPIGNGNQCNIHAPSPNNAYFTSPTASGALIYIAGVTGTTTNCIATNNTGTGDLEIYAAGFGTGGVLKSGAPTNGVSLGSPANEFAPLAEFYNLNIGTGEDLLFLVALCTGTNTAAMNITSGFPGATFAAGPNTVGLGSSGMIVDNNAKTTTGKYPEASSIYLNALQENAACNANTTTGTGAGSAPTPAPGTYGCAMKLTQAKLE